MCSSNGGGPALAPCPCAVHKRPIRVETGVDVVELIDEVDGFRMEAIDDGGFMPVGFGKRDDAVDTSLLIDFSEGAGDGGRCDPSGIASAFVSLIFLSFQYNKLLHLFFFNSLNSLHF